MLKNKLIKLEKTLEEKGIPSLKFLNQSASKTQIEEFLLKIFNNIKIHAELFELYSWHQGTTINYQLACENFYMFPTFYFNSLDAIESIYKNDSYNLIEKKMLPFYSSGHGEHLAFDLFSFYNDIQNTPIYIVQTWSAEMEMYTKIYENIYCMFDTVIMCYVDNAYYLNNGILEMDFNKSYNISKKMNPDSDYWKS